MDIGDRRAIEFSWEVVGRYADDGRSASQYASQSREDWETEVLPRIERGEAEILWLWEFSRGTRERMMWARLADACQRHSMFIALDDELWDTLNPDHMRYLDGLMADSVAESGKTRKRIIRDVAAQAEVGAPHGEAAFGFAREYDPKTGVLLRQVIDPGQAEIVREAAERFLGGDGLQTIAKDFNARGIPAPRGGRWHGSTLRYLLERPSLMGKRSWRGRIMESGGWPHIIDPPDWWAIQAKLRDPSRRKAKDTKARHLLSGIALCGEPTCRGKLRMRQDRWGFKYSCVGVYPGAPTGLGHVSRSERKTDRHVELMLAQRFSMRDVLERLAAGGGASENAGEVQAELEALEADLELAYEAAKRTGPGRLPMARLLEIEATLTPRIEELRGRLRPKAVDPMAQALADEDPARVLETWRGWTLEQQRSALRAWTEEIVVLRTGKTGRRELTAHESISISWVGA
ncbi:recombinase family protein [Nocardiopsis composta]|uniref:recombinase family protein n=1 Tax=Nocardiopsis composta TaxID=157465 RepID=UPI001FE2E863|nr:recombinase family protein [Nocardiopsis composta]